MNTTVQIPVTTPFNDCLSDFSAGLKELKIKLMIYYTSDKGCLSCWLNHLYDLDRILETDINNEFSPVIIISLDNNNENIFAQLKSHPHPHPIYIDKNDEFRKLNPRLPKDTRYHSFLLDKNNRVVLVGNPLASDAMWTLFRSTLDNMLAHDGVYVPEK